jgi:hypothetical protein
MYAPPPVSEQDMLRARGFWLYFRGFVITLLCGMGTLLVCTLLLDQLFAPLNGLAFRRATLMKGVLGMILIGVLPGLIIGACQYLVLWRSWTFARSWVSTSVAGWGLSALTYPAFRVLADLWHIGLGEDGQLQVVGLVYFAGGTLVGIWQAPGLRNTGRAQWIWPLLSAVAFGLTGALVYVLYDGIHLIRANGF